MNLLRPYRHVPAEVVTLWPEGPPTLKNVDQEEIFTLMPGRPERVQKVRLVRAGRARKGIPFGTWHKRFIEWLTDLGMMQATQC